MIKINPIVGSEVLAGFSGETFNCKHCGDDRIKKGKTEKFEKQTVSVQRNGSRINGIADGDPLPKGKKMKTIREMKRLLKEKGAGYINGTMWRCQICGGYNIYFSSPQGVAMLSMAITVDGLLTQSG